MSKSFLIRSITTIVTLYALLSIVVAAPVPNSQQLNAVSLEKRATALTPAEGRVAKPDYCNGYMSGNNNYNDNVEAATCRQGTSRTSQSDYDSGSRGYSSSDSSPVRNYNSPNTGSSGSNYPSQQTRQRRFVPVEEEQV
ncbi:hypothetical protein BGZ76_007813 [Entomortierella beljakovae]|nr:hypothetical protein BGZ76_007813 [Entomortierella beljakovae]